MVHGTRQRRSSIIFRGGVGARYPYVRDGGRLLARTAAVNKSLIERIIRSIDELLALFEGNVFQVCAARILDAKCQFVDKYYR